MTKDQLIDLINQHGVQDLAFESYATDGDYPTFVMRLTLKNGQQFTFEQDIQLPPPVISGVRVQENLNGDLHLRLGLPNK